MSRKKYEKNQFIIDKNLILSEVHDDSQAEDAVKKSIIKMSEIFRPLYSIITNENDKTLEKFSHPLFFVNAQMAKITKFLMLNSYYYYGLTNLKNCDDYFIRIDQIVSTIHHNIQDSFINKTCAPKESDEAIIVVKMFFEELDKLFIVPTYYIAYNINNTLYAINNINYNK